MQEVFPSFDLNEMSPRKILFTALLYVKLFQQSFKDSNHIPIMIANVFVVNSVPSKNFIGSFERST